VSGFPDEIRHEQRAGDRDCEREARRAQEIAPPDEERRHQRDEDDGERVLRLQPDSGGEPQERPGAAAEREPEREPEHDHRREQP
jgi:hypothetical protein